MLPCVHFIYLFIFFHPTSYLVYWSHSVGQVNCWPQPKAWAPMPCFWQHATAIRIAHNSAHNYVWWRNVFQHFGYNSFFVTKNAFSYCIQTNLIICYYRIKSNFHVNRGGIIPHLSTCCHNRLDIHQHHVFPQWFHRILHPLEQYKFSLIWLLCMFLLTI